jgi:hypothetical protein
MFRPLRAIIRASQITKDCRTKFNEKKPLQTKQHTHNTTYTNSKQSFNIVLNILNILLKKL